MKIEVFTQFQLGFMVTITSWYKGQRDIVLSLPFIDLSVMQIHRDFKNKAESKNESQKEPE